jgi:hypothetical protein
MTTPTDSNGSQIRRGRISGFIFAHKKWLSLVGLLIVLGTYIAKETLLDEAKQKVDSLEAARRQFELQKQSLSLRKTLFRIDKNGNASVVRSSTRPLRTKAQQTYDRDTDLVATYAGQNSDDREALDLIRDEFKAGEDLASTFPKDEVALKSVKQSKTDIDAATAYLLTLKSNIEEFDEKMGDPVNYEHRRKEMIEMFLGSGMQLNEANQAVEAMDNDLTSEATSLSQQQTARTHRIQLLSHLFFLIGWALSLLDKVYFDSPVSANT